MPRRSITLAALALLPVAAGGCEVFDPLTTDQAIKLMDDPSSADNRRQGIAYLVTHDPAAVAPPYPRHYQRLAKSDPDYTVRAMAIRALNVCRDRSATPIFIAALADENEPVRLEAAKALANVPDPAAVPGLLAALRGERHLLIGDRDAVVPEAPDVRIAAADALRQYPTLNVERTLVGFLNDQFALAWQSRQSLVALTGQDLRYDEVAWLRYLVVAGG